MTAADPDVALSVKGRGGPGVGGLNRWVGRVAVILGACALGVTGLVGPSPGDAGAFAANPADPRMRAWDWVRSQLDPSAGAGETMQQAATLAPDRVYSADWTGPVSGTFTLVEGASPPPVEVAAVELDTPAATAAADPDYRGPITGRVTLPTATGRWILQAYRVDAGGARMLPVQALAGPDGTFTMDLAAAGDPGPGRWEIGVLDAFTGYAPTGERWPTPGTYRGWQVRSYAVTDRAYLLDAAPARSDGTFSFAASAPGRKRFELVAPGAGPDGSDLVLGRYAPATGLIRTPTTDPATATAYAYDQGLALQAALVLDDADTADLLVTGLLAMQRTSGPQAGAFPVTASQGNPQVAPPVYRTGAHAVATYALLSALRDRPADDPQRPAIRAAAAEAVDWLIAQQVTDGPNAGLLTGGWGDLSGPGGTANPTPRIRWISTEHNLDAWHTLNLAADLLSCARCAAAADDLRAAVPARLWQPDGGFRQGLDPDGPDLTEPLDVQTWGGIWLQRIGRSDLAAVALGRTDAFTVTDGGITGMLAFRAQPSVPNPVPSVWFEGTFGLALAQARLGDATGHSATMAALAAGQRPDGSFPMATTADPDRELTTESSVAATTWFLLAGAPAGADGLWT